MSVLSTILAFSLGFTLGLAMIGVIVYYSDWMLVDAQSGDIIGRKNLLTGRQTIEFKVEAVNNE